MTNLPASLSEHTPYLKLIFQSLCSLANASHSFCNHLPLFADWSSCGDQTLIVIAPLLELVSEEPDLAQPARPNIIVAAREAANTFFAFIILFLLTNSLCFLYTHIIEFEALSLYIKDFCLMLNFLEFLRI